MANKIPKSKIIGVYELTIQKHKYSTISKMLMIDELTVKKIAEGVINKEDRSSYIKIDLLRKETRRRKSYYHSYVTPYKIKKVEKLWLKGNGREKIISKTGYGQSLVQKIIAKLVDKHGRKRADAKCIQ